jgi:RNA polymerase sigma-70 factor (ECF subfamily)
LSLLERILRHDHQGWDHFYYIYSPLIQHVCRKWGLQASDADDVTQEVFQAVTASIATYRREQEGQVCTFRNWLGGVIRNKIRDHFKRKAGQPQMEGDLNALEPRKPRAEAESAEEDGEADAYREVCLRALERIRPGFSGRHWQAFWRTSVDGQPAPSVAAELGMSPAAVRQAKSRIMRCLREELCEVAASGPSDTIFGSVPSDPDWPHSG